MWPVYEEVLKVEPGNFLVTNYLTVSYIVCRKERDARVS